MGILLAVIGALGLVFFGFFVVVRIIQIVSLIAIFIFLLGFALVLGVSGAIGIASAALTYQLLGENYIGLVIAVGILVALLIAYSLAKKLVNQLKKPTQERSLPDKAKKLNYRKVKRLPLLDVEK